MMAIPGKLRTMTMKKTLLQKKGPATSPAKTGGQGPKGMKKAKR